MNKYYGIILYKEYKIAPLCNIIVVMVVYYLTMRNQFITDNKNYYEKPLLDKEEFDSLANYYFQKQKAEYSVQLHSVGLGAYEVPQIKVGPKEYFSVALCFVLWSVLFTKMFKRYLDRNKIEQIGQ